VISASIACAITMSSTHAIFASCEVSYDKSCYPGFRLSAADERRGRASWPGQLRRDINRTSSQRRDAASAHGRLWHFSAVPTALSNIGYGG
jgi:hypothetical protein